MSHTKYCIVSQEHESWLAPSTAGTSPVDPLARKEGKIDKLPQSNNPLSTKDGPGSGDTRIPEGRDRVGARGAEPDFQRGGSGGPRQRLASDSQAR